MTIRSRLLLGYLAVLLIVFIVGYFSIHSILEWNAAGNQLSRMYGKGLLTERLRTNSTRQINSALNYLNGDLKGKEEFFQIQGTADQILEELKSDTISVDEIAHIRGLEETQFELVWLANRYFEGRASKHDRENSHSKLRDIADEVADEVATLNQFYRSRENESLRAAKRAGNIATSIIWSAVVISIIQLVVLMYLLNKWLAKPITEVTKRTLKISEGDFDARTELNSNDEWGQLSQAINDMASSLKASRQKLLAQERLAALGEIASYTAHNLRNPLAGIRAAAQLSMSENKAENTATNEAFTDIISAVDRMDLWIKRFLEYAKPMTLYPESINLNLLLQQVVSTAQKPFFNKNITLKLELANGLPQINIDSILFEQVLTVIFNNAFESIDNAGTICIRTELIKSDLSIDMIKIKIEDNGKGIPKQVLEKMFRPFVTTKEGGTGLGLAQAKKIIDLHSGAMALSNLSGGGASVEIVLPISSK